MLATAQQGLFRCFVFLLLCPAPALAHKAAPIVVEVRACAESPRDEAGLRENCLPGRSSAQYPPPAGNSDKTAFSHPEVSEWARLYREALDGRIGLLPHRSNYVLPLSYSLEPETFTGVPDPRVSQAYKSVEVQFQLSVQVPLWSGIAGESSLLSLAYTNRSFWQSYASSAPFRETNHEPELIMTWLPDWQLFGLDLVASQVAFSHQSNGRGGDESRGWNRVYTNFVFEKKGYFLSLKPWYRIPEDHVGDDNPDLEFYLGHFEFRGGYHGPNYSTSMMLRNNLRSDNRGAVELSWSFPLGERVRGLVRYFNGYGESLINYDQRVQSIGIGIEVEQGF